MELACHCKVHLLLEQSGTVERHQHEEESLVRHSRPRVHPIHGVATRHRSVVSIMRQSGYHNRDTTVACGLLIREFQDVDDNTNMQNLVSDVASDVHRRGHLRARLTREAMLLTRPALAAVK